MIRVQIQSLSTVDIMTKNGNGEMATCDRTLTLERYFGPALTTLVLGLRLGFQ